MSYRSRRNIFSCDDQNNILKPKNFSDFFSLSAKMRVATLAVVAIAMFVLQITAGANAAVQVTQRQVRRFFYIFFSVVFSFSWSKEASTSYSSPLHAWLASSRLGMTEYNRSFVSCVDLRFRLVYSVYSPWSLSSASACQQPSVNVCHSANITWHSSLPSYTQIRRWHAASCLRLEFFFQLADRSRVICGFFPRAHT